MLFRSLYKLTSKNEIHYAWTDDELREFTTRSKGFSIQRFKGLGEISPDEFRHFIGKDIRLDRITWRKEDVVKGLLEFYMGKNTSERQNFIIDNLVIEEE